MFGPYAGFTPKFLKTGSYLDLFASIRWHNIGTMVGAGLTNLSLVWYLITELLATPRKRHQALRQFAPRARRSDWRLITAGQRVQIMKRDAAGKAVIQFGTEIVASADGTIAGLLGASPGASTAVPIMLDLLERVSLTGLRLGPADRADDPEATGPISANESRGEGHDQSHGKALDLGEVVDGSG